MCRSKDYQYFLMDIAPNFITDTVEFETDAVLELAETNYAGHLIEVYMIQESDKGRITERIQLRIRLADQPC